MTTYERFENILKDLNFDVNHPRSVYLKAEAELISLIRELIIGETVNSSAYGLGTVIDCSGNTVNNLSATIAFADTLKKFSLAVIFSNNKFTYFKEAQALSYLWDIAMSVHTRLTVSLSDAEILCARRAEEALAEQRAAEKAEAAYQKSLKAKEKAIQDFELAINQHANSSSKSEINDFYFSLGWMARHLIRIQAMVPDYLLSSFEKHFGPGLDLYVVDTNKRTSGGHKYQWTVGFVMNFSIKNLTPVPDFLTTYYNAKYNSIMKTSFIWDLVDDYGFQIGRKQDIEKIKSYIPEAYLESFNAGLSA